MFFVILKVQRIDFNSLVLILYIYLLEKRKLMCLFHPHFLDVYILPILTIFIFPYSPKKYFNSSSDISGHSPLVTNKLVFFLYDFIRCSFDIHMHSRSSFPGVIFLPQVFYAFYFSLLYYCLGYLFTSCVYIHFILYYILWVYIIFILVMFVLLLLSKPFLYCLFSHVNLVLHSHTFYFPIFFKFFSEFMF